MAEGGSVAGGVRDGSAVTTEELATGLAAAARVCRGRLIELGEEIAARHDVKVDDVPRPSSVMVELGSPVGDFCLGEVVVTSAGVSVGPSEGWACVVGYDEEGAVAAALCAAAGGEGARLLAREALEEEAARYRREMAAAESTRIDP